MGNLNPKYKMHSANQVQACDGEIPRTGKIGEVLCLSNSGFD